MKKDAREPDIPLAMENNSSDVLLIFQAPGEIEWSKKIPICSDSNNSAAARIRNSLNRIGKTRQDFNITNATQCYPGKSLNGRDAKPVKSARNKCANLLKNNIESSSFRKFIVFGSLAKESIEFLGFKNDNRFIFLLHPSGGLSNEKLDLSLSAL